MTVLKIFFWFSLFIVFYSYIGYGILLFFLVQIKKIFVVNKTKNTGSEQFEPEISLIVSSYNEKDFIERKIENTLKLTYPADKLKIIFITDGSSDSTAQIISRYQNIILLHNAE